MAKFCRECGKPLRASAKFCGECGTKVVISQPAEQPAPARTAPPAPEPAPVRITEPAPQPAPIPEAPAPAPLPAPAAAAAERAVSTAQNAAASRAGALAKSVLGREVSAAQEAGETVLGELLPVRAEAAAVSAGLPIGTLFGGLGSFAGGIFGSLLKPWKLLLAALMACVWILLAELQTSNETWVKAASFLTFAKGGLHRETLAGTVGGMLGKGVTAVALGSLFTGGLGKAAKGLAAPFRKGEHKSLIGALCGLAIGAALYVAFAGWDLAGKDTAMAGVAGALLCLEGMGSESGWLYRLAGAFTAKAKSGVRELQAGKAASLMAGMAAGFAAAAACLAIR